MSYVNKFVIANNLLPGDAILLKKKFVGMFDHFAIYLGRDRQTNNPIFAANSVGGVQIIEYHKANDFLQQLVPQKIERFTGSLAERNSAIQRAFSWVGKKGYNLIFNNCEHYKNFVQFGDKYSGQVNKAANAALLAGGLTLASGIASKKNNMAAAGLVGLALGVILKIASDQNE